MTILIIVLTLAVAAGLGWPITVGVLRLARMTEESGSEQAAQPAGVLRGGLLIGTLERLGVALCLLFDQSFAIAFIVAIKGLGRYPELKSAQAPAVSERFIIGTLASMLWAAAVGITGRWLLTLL
ncbi:hypothetical protein ODZ83_06390 [Acaricomes phytoseiuli]|nr:hypothetical protein [Acaricomes phytoseiuli]MCW1249817.1 hypothetical protein [Acaricomes phytoseiuli]